MKTFTDEADAIREGFRLALYFRKPVYLFAGWSPGIGWKYDKGPFYFHTINRPDYPYHGANLIGRFIAPVHFSFITRMKLKTLVFLQGPAWK